MARIVVYGINYAPELTGIGRFSGEMAVWLSRRGHDVRVVTAPPYYPAWRVGQGYRWWAYRNEFLAGVKVTRCPVWVPRAPSGMKRLLHLASFALSSLPILLREAMATPDRVVVVEPPIFCAPAGLLLARLAGAKSWLHIQDFEVDAAFELGILRNHTIRLVVECVERWLMRRFHSVSSISGRMVKRISVKGVSIARTRTFTNWVDTRHIYPLNRASSLRRELRIGEDVAVCLYAGNMGLKQGLEIIIESARRLEERSDIRFVMCGQGAAFDALQKLAGSLGNILWLPLQPENRLNELLNLADIHLLPQRADAADLVMPSKLTGMLASGRPVIALANPGTEVWEVVQGCGLNSPPGDINAFRDAILHLAENSELRRKYGLAARSYAERHLDKDAILGRFEEALLGCDK